MSRINAGIDPRSLTRQHLLAEHREIKRIPNAVRARLDAGKPVAVGPDEFCLGKGHVTFFYRRLGYLLRRYQRLRAECLRRKYDVSDFSGAWSGLPDEFMGEWEPSPQDRALIEQRIAERLAT